jgi:hypothetical protein
MSRYCLLEPGKPGVTYPGGWGDYTATSATIATLKALYDPIIGSEAADAGSCKTLYFTTHTAHIIDTDEDPPALVAISSITSRGVASWADV